MHRRHGRLKLRHIAPLTTWLLALNLVAFAWSMFVVPADAVGSLYYYWGLVPARLMTWPGLQTAASVVTSMFLHGGWLHLGANMLMLYFLGKLLEPRLGSLFTAGLYLLSGVTAAAAQIALDPGSTVPMVGASGAISGLLGAAVVLTPLQRVMVVTPLTLFIPITLKMRTLGLAWLVLQAVGMAGADLFGGLFGGGIAYAAHIGGYLGGYWLLHMIGARPRRARRPAGRPAPEWTGPASEWTGPARPGPAPDARSRTYWVTDAQGRTYAFHEPI